jgi:exopolysaccharide biosynthesis protein
MRQPAFVMGEQANEACIRVSSRRVRDHCPRAGAVDGAVPQPLRGEGRGIDVAHRDARLAIGVASDGTLIVALTRFDALGARLGFVPFGLTVPEMAALMGALGARDAMLLDGGISAQLLVRDVNAVAHRWPGARAVPLALIMRSRTE